jgi:hypothetical protein
MSEQTAETVFWIGHLPLMFVFLGGMWLVFANWLKGSIKGDTDASTGKRLGALLRIVLGTVSAPDCGCSSRRLSSRRGSIAVSTVTTSGAG